MPRVCRTPVALRCDPCCAVAARERAVLSYVAGDAVERAAYRCGFHERADAMSAFVICEEHNLPGFETINLLKAYYAELPAVKMERFGLCRHCGRWHAIVNIDRIERSGPIPPAAQATGNRISARDTERHRTL